MHVITIEHNEDLAAKQMEIQSKVDAYKAAQAYQAQNGGPGPVADYDVMKIVNEFNGQFTIEQKPAPVVEEPVVSEPADQEPVDEEPVADSSTETPQ